MDTYIIIVLNEQHEKFSAVDKSVDAFRLYPMFFYIQIQVTQEKKIQYMALFTLKIDRALCVNAKVKSC